jgi:hypothetical protein
MKRLLSASAISAVPLFLFLVFTPAFAAEGVRTPQVLREGQPDLSSVEAIIASIVRPGMSQQEKAMAVYDFVRTHIYHWGTAKEYPDRNSYDYGVVYDPVKLVNVYGYGYCFQNRAAAEALWHAAGLEARSAGIGGHSIAEAFYDGQYHYLDTDQHGYCLLPDGRTAASIEQITRDPIGLILNQPKPSNPFFPAGKDPKIPYESKILFTGYFASTDDNFYQHDKTVMGHRMDITLLPGMRYERHFTSDGRWNIHNGSSEFEYKVGYHDPRVGPKDFLSDTGYANGELLYQPDLTTRSPEYAAGVWEESNIKVTDTGLVPAEAGKPAWCVFRIRVPYAIAGWPTSFVGPANVRGAAVVSAVLHRQADDPAQGLDVSVDRGSTWTPVWTNLAAGKAQAVVDLSEQAAARYEYLVRIRLGDDKSAGTRLESLGIRTAFQIAPRSLPALAEGKNRMTFRLGDETETLEFVADLRNSDNFVRDVKSYKGVWLQGGSIVSKLSRPGEVIYELKPPRPGTVAGFHAELGCRREPFGLHPDDDIKIFYAENQPENWKLVYDDEFPPYAQHWCYHANGSAVCAPGTKSVFVKIGIRSASSASIQRIQMRLRWKPEGSGGMPERGVRVEHSWTESGADKKFSTVVKTAPADYAVETGKGIVNRYVVMEPVRADGLKWRENDPAVAAPPVPDQKVLDEALRDEMRSLLRGIDADPKTGLPKAMACKIEWLAGGAKQASAMYGMKFPVAPKGADPAADPLKDDAGKAAAEKTMAGNDWYAKLKLLDGIRAGGVKSLPDFVIKGLNDPISFVRLAVLQAVREAKDAKAADALKAMAKDDPKEWLREEAKSVLKELAK